MCEHGVLSLLVLGDLVSGVTSALGALAVRLARLRHVHHLASWVGLTARNRLKIHVEMESLVKLVGKDEDRIKLIEQSIKLQKNKNKFWENIYSEASYMTMRTSIFMILTSEFKR